MYTHTDTGMRRKPQKGDLVRSFHIVEECKRYLTPGKWYLVTEVQELRYFFILDGEGEHTSCVWQGQDLYLEQGKEWEIVSFEENLKKILVDEV